MVTSPQVPGYSPIISINPTFAEICLVIFRTKTEPHLTLTVNELTMSTTLPKTYTDPDSEAAHVATYERKPRHPIKPALPPGVKESEFNQAIQSFTSIVGKEAVFIDSALSDYIDPYDVNEADPTKRKVPGAAVWYVFFLSNNSCHKTPVFFF